LNRDNDELRTLNEQKEKSMMRSAGLKMPCRSSPTILAAKVNAVKVCCQRQKEHGGIQDRHEETAQHLSAEKDAGDL
jgi:hypothetical protein